ncbi:hypothetical protein BL02_141 [Klebsiella phage BL02]|uniref:Uncharacterized protein n=3 Tax=Slopekvirus TaxID=1985328 RepID=A0A0K2FHY4_9CAUD|nr:hypothetical protein CPT_Matisse141 [Klebsiella phage Matisse]YP_009607058.1 hypothetical protein FDI05_gp141 [Enterobacter phage phiEap-3]YP_009607337.1 hypothetical protein FDI06_gp216 [Klebsiella phage Miro]QWY13855.1 hypothetical protein [Klebsiella phage vB_KpnM_VAC13]URQ04394.1 hypothetical protein BL02_141 [Klebsiella phage BL02]UXD79435.1 hypothetical protein OJNDCHOG_00850 [Klebsiella phage 150040]WDQ26417.1 hypothetical protein phiKPNS3_00151 [Klebsiella phage phi_KPN_S3]WKC5500
MSVGVQFTVLWILVILMGLVVALLYRKNKNDH